MALTPATQTDGGKTGTSVPYKLTIENNGFSRRQLLALGHERWTTTFFDATCTTPLTTTPTIPGGGSLDVCAKVDVPAALSNGAAEHRHGDGDVRRKPGASARPQR